MRAATRTVLIAQCLLAPHDAFAHPAPFSYLDLHLNTGGVSGTVVMHDLDAAHDS